MTDRHVRQLARRIASLEKAVQAQNLPQLGNSSIEDGALRSGNNAYLTNDGVKIAAAPTDEDGEPVEAATLGSAGANAFGTTDADGQVTSRLTGDGDLTVNNATISGDLAVNGAAWFDGEPVGGNSPGDGTNGPTILGVDLVGPAVQGSLTAHNGNPDGDVPWLDGMSVGLIVQGSRSCTASEGWGFDNTNGTDFADRGITSLSWNAYAGRAYQVNFVAPSVSGSGPGGLVGVFLIKVSTTDGGNANLTSGRYAPGGYLYIPMSSGLTSLSRTLLIRCPDDVPEGLATVWFGERVYAGQKIIHGDTGGAEQAIIQVYDVGRADPGNSGVDDPIKPTEPGQPPPDNPPPPPPKSQPKTYVKTVNCSGSRTFKGNGSPNSFYNGKGLAAQGYVGSAGNMQSMLVFPDLTGSLAGSDVTKLEVYLSFRHWWANSGGTAVIGTHANSGLVGSADSMSTLVHNRARSHFGNPEGHWVSLPSSTFNAVKAGLVRGIVLGFGIDSNGNPSTSSAYYGYVLGSACKLRVTYRK